MQPQLIVKTGLGHVKKPGLVSWWKKRWLVLTASALIVYKDPNTTHVSIMFSLAELRKVERVQSLGSRRCLVLETDHRQCCISFPDDRELYSWQEAIYSHSSLSSPIVPPEPNDLHALISNYVNPDDASTNAESESPGWPPPNTLYIAPIPMQGDISPTTDTPNELNQRDTLKKAVSTLCNVMEARLLRKSEPGHKPSNLVEIRLRALLRLQRKWAGNQHQGVVQPEDMKAFREALQDGYVLCQLMNTMQSNTVLRPGHDESMNVQKFLKACSNIGLDDLFSPTDLIDESLEGLVHVARTIIAFVDFFQHDTLERKTTQKSVATKESAQPIHNDLDHWLEQRILVRQSKLALRGDGDVYRSSAFTSLPGRSYEDLGQEAGGNMIYEYATLLLISEARNESLRASLERLADFMRSLDPISSLVENRQFRVKLLQTASILRVSDDRRLKEAVQKDDVELGNLLRVIVDSDKDRKAVLCLRGDDAQNFVDLIQDVLDKGTIRNAEDESFTLKCRRLLVKLSEAHDILPSSLFIEGVQRLDKEATFGGSFGDIFRAQYKGGDVALKRIRVFQRESGVHKIRQHFCREALLWQRLRHPYVLPFTGIDSESFPSFLCMVSPWMKHGTILKHLTDNGFANVELRLFEIAQGLAYLHSQNIVHGDLRGTNILVNDNWHAVLADFGLAVFSDATAATRTSHQAGSVRWMAPELTDPQSFGLQTFQRTLASDVYSFACVGIELYTGKPPFANLPHDPAAMLRVLAGERPSRPEMPDHIWNIIELCWKQDYSERPVMAEVVEMMRQANDDLVDTPNPAKPSVPVNRPPSSRFPKGLRVLHRQDSRSF